MKFVPRCDERDEGPLPLGSKVLWIRDRVTRLAANAFLRQPSLRLQRRHAHNLELVPIDGQITDTGNKS